MKRIIIPIILVISIGINVYLYTQLSEMKQKNADLAVTIEETESAVNDLEETATTVIIGKITSATISSVVTNKGMTTISNSDVEKYLSSIKNIISNDGKIVVASRNREFLVQNNMSVDTIIDILLNLKVSDCEVSDIDLRAKESDMIKIFMPIYKGKKL